MKGSFVSAVAAVALLTGSAFAQNAAKPASEGAQAPAGGGEAGERKLPQGGAPNVPGAKGGTASPGMKPNAAAEPQPGTKQQGENVGVEPNKADGSGAQAEPKPGTQGQAQPGGKAGEKQPAQDQTKPAGAKNAGAARPAPKLTQEQTTRVKTVFRDVHIQPVRVDFNVDVGVAVPRTVVLQPVPPTIVSIVPAYEGFEYFFVPGQIVIVDPETLEIVYVLPL